MSTHTVACPEHAKAKSFFPLFVVDNHRSGRFGLTSWQILHVLVFSLIRVSLLRYWQSNLNLIRPQNLLIVIRLVTITMLLFQQFLDGRWIVRDNSLGLLERNVVRVLGNVVL